MTPERIAGLVAAWVRLYTRNLPAPIARRRIDEIGADLRDHIAHDRAHGIADRRIALGIAGRMLRGMAADASWRGRMIARTSTRKDTKKMTTPARRTALRLALATAAAALGLAAIAYGEADDSPGLMLLGCLLIAGTVALSVRTARRSE